MFVNISVGVINTALVPDVCKTPAAAGAPIPYPNIVMSSLHIPAQFQVMFGIGLAENLMTQGTISMGDQAGLAGGVVSNTFMGPDRYLLGSLKMLIGGFFAMRLTSLTGHNGMPCNTVGASLTPGQFRVMVLS